MRFPLLALAIAAGAVSSIPLYGQNLAPNGIDVPLEAKNSFAIGASGNENARAGEYAGLEVTQPASHSTANVTTNVANASVEIDWRIKGAVTPVSDTGQCGSDWAFSAKGAVEGERFLTTGVLPNLSAQQLVDCAGAFGSQGCNGGYPEDGLRYIERYGSASAASYPYTARDGVCRTASSVAKIGRVERLPIGDDAALLANLEQHGPISVIVDDSWISGYKGAIKTCSSRVPSFISALLVGAVTRNGEPVWILKFSLGTAWGDKGYAYLSRLRKNECGITDYAVVPLP